VFPVSLTISPIRDAGGAIVGASVIARDMTEQRKAFDAAQRMAAIVEGSDDAIISGALDGSISSWNPAAEKMYGYYSAEAIGKPAALLTPKDRVGEIEAVLEQIKAGRHVEHLETKRVRKDGRVFPVSLTVSPIRDEDGAVVGASSITRDVTEARQAYEAARSMIESSLDSVTSRVIEDAPTTAPSASRIGETVSKTGNTVPSFRTRTVSKCSTSKPALTLARLELISPVRSSGLSWSMDWPSISSLE
jgi:PAS domain S-box-containing protein